MTTEKKDRKPFFCDVTLRDGNQALRRPWNLMEKERVFHQLLKLRVQGIEVGYSGASSLDFEACRHLAGIAPANVVICGLARAVEKDIVKVWDAIQTAPVPRIHFFISTSTYNMKYVLRMNRDQVLKKAAEASAISSKLMGGRGSIQFSAEHFGDCRENLDFVLDVFRAVIENGTTVINLPNTVERYRPSYFVEMVHKVVAALPSDITIAVHNHNDLGMATATTVESYFAGATQLETTLNGLGERAGNTNIFEVACALYNCGVEVPISMQDIYESAVLTAEWSRIPIPEKAALVGSDVISHRSGIHQDGAFKTKEMKKGAYRAIDLNLIGRKESDRIGFTSQSGKTAIYEILRSVGLPITLNEASQLQPVMKKLSEESGELDMDAIFHVYDKEILNVDGPLEFIDLEADSKRKRFVFSFKYNGEERTAFGEGTGPVEACFHALKSIGLAFRLLEYKQHAQDVELKDFAANAISEIILKGGANGSGPTVTARARDLDTVKANVKALFNGVNLLFREGTSLQVK